MQLQILTPEKTIFDSKIKELTLPGKNGSFQILNDHAPLVSSLASGTIKVKIENDELLDFNINGGIIELNNNKIIVLCD